MKWYYYADDGCEGCLGSAMKWCHRILKGRFDRKLPQKRFYEELFGDRGCGDKSADIRVFKMECLLWWE